MSEVYFIWTRLGGFEINTGMGCSSADEAINAVQSQDWSEGIGMVFIQRPAAGDFMEGLARWGGQ